ncbi:MAG: hypothetical protein BWK78_03695 [Thiotrichaceae bacterium IS1]|nr:MAG: hypothetical protein BWK78_03695 [Thiotrichaceae bacterium IS1]
MMIAMLVIGLLQIFFAEKITVGGGLGWDGSIYGHLVTDFPESLCQITAYHVQRVVPSLMVYWGLYGLGLPHSDVPTVIRGFEFLNLFWLVVATWAWGQIADEIKIKNKWLGFTALFVNYFILKWNFYYPVLTDTTAFALGILMLLAYLKNWVIPLMVLTLVGTFTWPTLIYCGILLLAFPRTTACQSRANHPDSSILVKFSKELSTILAFLVAGMVAGEAVYLHYILKSRHGGAPVILSVVNLSICGLAAYLFLISRPWFENFLKRWVTWLTFRTLSRVILSVLFFILLKILIVELTRNNSLTGLDLSNWVRVAITVSIVKPLVFLLAHIVFFGPIILMAIFLWKQLCTLLFKYGLGVSFVILVGILMSITSESRQLLNFFPIVAIFTAKLLDDLPLKPNFYVWFLAISFLSSKVWVNMNIGIDNIELDMKTTAFELPWQWLFGVGYFMSNEMYIAQGIVVILIAMFFYFEFLKGLANK